MRRIHIVTYDIADDKRLRLVHRKMRGYGDHLQYSVFRCELSDKEKIQMIAELDELLHHTEDQVLIIPLGPADGYNHANIQALGKPYTYAERCATVV